MVKKQQENVEQKNPLLIKPRDEIKNCLEKRIDKGKEILQFSIQSEEDLRENWSEQEKWHSFNIDYLKHCFDTPTIAEEYKDVSHGYIFMSPSFDDQIRTFKITTTSRINKLESIIERLSIYQEHIHQTSIIPSSTSYNSNDVFIVHGHDETIKQNVARVTQKLGLNPIILHEQQGLRMKNYVDNSY